MDHFKDLGKVSRECLNSTESICIEACDAFTQVLLFLVFCSRMSIDFDSAALQTQQEEEEYDQEDYAREQEVLL